VPADPYWNSNVARHPEVLRAVPDGCVEALDVGCGPRFVEGDFLAADLRVGHYDFVCSVTAIHRREFEPALARMRDLLRPGGTLVVVGLAREATLTDWGMWVAATPVVRITKVLRRASVPAGVPTLAPSMSYREVRESSRRLLPGVRYRRHVLRRYSLTWRKPYARHPSA